uniref:PK domain-containing protein n=1 Tax=Meloidogyne hapla TaxID=6305 RepID=A0A1I8BN74_MELHA
MAGSFVTMGDALCVVVADEESNRADLKITGGEAAGLRLLRRGDALQIEDECIVATTDMLAVRILNKSKEIGSVLTTPKKSSVFGQTCGEEPVRGVHVKKS